MIGSCSKRFFFGTFANIKVGALYKQHYLSGLGRVISATWGIWKWAMKCEVFTWPKIFMIAKALSCFWTDIIFQSFYKMIKYELFKLWCWIFWLNFQQTWSTNWLKGSFVHKRQMINMKQQYMENWKKSIVDIMHWCFSLQLHCFCLEQEGKWHSLHLLFSFFWNISK